MGTPNTPRVVLKDPSRVLEPPRHPGGAHRRRQALDREQKVSGIQAMRSCEDDTGD